jgi:hypothetical protein
MEAASVFMVDLLHANDLLRGSDGTDSCKPDSVRLNDSLVRLSGDGEADGVSPRRRTDEKYPPRGHFAFFLQLSR